MRHLNFLAYWFIHISIGAANDTELDGCAAGSDETCSFDTSALLQGHIHVTEEALAVEGDKEDAVAAAYAATWMCSVCHLVYDAASHGGGLSFEALPETWKCPECGAPKSAFKKSVAAKKPDGQEKSAVKKSAAAKQPVGQEKPEASSITASVNERSAYTLLSSVLGVIFLIAVFGFAWVLMQGEKAPSEPPETVAETVQIPQSSPKGTSWMDMSWLMLSDIIGTGVLTFTAVSHSLGWALTVLAMLCLWPISFYVAVVMCRTRRLLLEEASAASGTPPLGSFGAVARYAWRSDNAASVVYILVYGATLMGNASYLLVMARTVQQVFYSAPLCLYGTAAVACLIVLVPLFTVRRLNESVWLCLINTVLIVLVLAIGLADVVRRGKPEDANPEPISPGLSLLGMFGAITNIMFSFTGQWMYFELMETMSEPDDFPRAFIISGPVMMVSYLSVALIGYFYTSHSVRGDLLSLMEPSPTLRVVAVLLFLHVIVLYTIKSLVLARHFHSIASPSDVDARTPISYLKHGGFGCAMLGFGYVVVNTIPFFDPLFGLIGGLLAAPINFLIPICLYVTARGHQMQSKQKLGKSGVWDSMRMGFSSLAGWEMALITFIVLFVSAAATIGVADRFSHIVKDWNKYGDPFTCQALTFVTSAR